MTLPNEIIGNHKLMMQSPDYWQRWPLLPVKRDIGKDREVGVLLDRKPYLVYLVNLWAVQDGLDGAESIEYESVDAVLADGWIVD